MDMSLTELEWHTYVFPLGIRARTRLPYDALEPTLSANAATMPEISREKAKISFLRYKNRQRSKKCVRDDMLCLSKLLPTQYDCPRDSDAQTNWH